MPNATILRIGMAIDLKEFSLWAQPALFYLWAIFMVSLGVLPPAATRLLRDLPPRTGW
jgi:hypothetical protein